MTSSCPTMWEASDYLCDYLRTDKDLRSKCIGRLLELGSGNGECGLLAYHLLRQSQLKSMGNVSIVLTEADDTALKLLRENVARLTDPNDETISCLHLAWGRGEAEDFLSQQGEILFDGQQEDFLFDIILGSALSDIGQNTERVLETVDELLGKNGKFILAHDERCGVQVEAIVRAANEKNLFHEELDHCGQIHLLCFRRVLAFRRANNLVGTLQDRTSVLETENRTLHASKVFLEEKCRCLEERCALLSGDCDNFPMQRIGDSTHTMIPPGGLTTGDATDHLCDYLVSDVELKSRDSCRLLELGSGLGKCGLLAHRLASSPGRKGASTVLTDCDSSTLQLLRRNVAQNTDPNDKTISCKLLDWSRGWARYFLSQQQLQRGFDIILGSDIIDKGTYLGDLDYLFQAVNELLDKDGKFILAHDEGSEVREETILFHACQANLFREILRQEGQIYILCFRKLTMRNVNTVTKRLKDRNRALEMENQSLQTSKGLLENRCQCLEDRCTALRREKEDVPQSILLSFCEDDIGCIASYLEPRDFAALSMTCKQFGLKMYSIGNDPAFLWQMAAYRLYAGASAAEKEALPVYKGDTSPFFFYNELLELRKPLQFDRLFGRLGIEHAVGDKSQLVKTNHSGRFMMPREGILRFYAYTAASNHVMRAGKHYVKFTCSAAPRAQEVLWFGIVRPLKRFKSKSLFTPFCTRFVRELRRMQTAEWGDSAIDCCVYDAASGECQWKEWDPANIERDEIYSEDWPGMQPFAGGTIGMLLDYDAGTLTVYKNDVKLGVMMHDLTGPYSWVVSVGTWFERSSEGIKIERGPPPA